MRNDYHKAWGQLNYTYTFLKTRHPWPSGTSGNPPDSNFTDYVARNNPNFELNSLNFWIQNWVFFHQVFHLFSGLLIPWRRKVRINTNRRDTKYRHRFDKKPTSSPTSNFLSLLFYRRLNGCYSLRQMFIENSEWIQSSGIG